MQYNINGVMLFHLIKTNKDMDYDVSETVTADDAEAAKDKVYVLACKRIRHVIRDAAQFRWSGEPEVMEVPQDVIMRELGCQELFEYPGGEE